MRLLAALLLAVTAGAAEPPRFFLEGDGTLDVRSAHSGDRATVRFRRADGTYDAEAIARVTRIFRSSDGRQGEISLRLIEVLGYLQGETAVRPLVLQSGYRSPAYNEGLRAQGRQAASGSLHTEGLAADVAFPRATLDPLWHQIRDLDCCGAGLYSGNGFLHVDVGRPRFWTATTSRVDENLSAGNARLFARTTYDRYVGGEAIEVTLHALTLPPVGIGHEVTVVPEHGAPVTVPLAGAAGCVEVTNGRQVLRLTAPAAPGRVRLRLATCEPRIEATPETVETNPIEIR
jgi:uncharacterized protein YcbK (DUF882 family)